MNTDMSAFIGLSPNNDLEKKTYAGVVSIHGIIYDLYYVIMNSDHVEHEH